MPRPQTVHAVLPEPLAYDPGPHAEQAGAPSIDEYVPALHAEHEFCAPADEEVPSGHGLQSVAPDVPKVPAGQMVHEDAPASEP